MKETRFIAQNKEKWIESEALLSQPVKDPEKLSNLFTQVVDDLSYSRTYYPNRSVRVYLNKIAREYFSIIYSHQKEKKNRFKLFWLEELPQIVIYAKRPLLISLFLFLLSACIGVFSSYKDPHFTSTILGESYVSMTKANIEKGDPMAVYKEGHQVDMFLGITMNNLMVAFRTYVFGVFLSIGTIAILLYNGIMVGCFQFFFVERGLFAESALTIWLHGTLEISSIILAGGAGLTLGSGLLFPGTYSRLQAFQVSAIRSLKLMLGITPIFVLAGIIESFLTRYTEVPDILRLFLILASAFLIVGYFVVYPWMKSRRGFEHPLEEIKLSPSQDESPSYTRIKNNAEILKDAFIFYKHFASKLLPWIGAVTLGLTVADFFLTDGRGEERIFTEWWIYLFDNLFYALKTPTAAYILINAIGFSLIIYRVLVLIDSDAKFTSIKLFGWRSFVHILVITGAAFGILYLLEQWGVILLLFVFIFFIIATYIQHTEQLNIFGTLSRTWNLSGANFGQVMGLQLILLLLMFSFLMVLSAPLIYMNLTVLQWNFAKTDVWAQYIVDFIEMFIRILAFNLILPILAAASVYTYYSLHEIASADNLKRAIQMIGTKQKSGKR
ncbi:MAG TPA: stage II sporulation protein M [Ohtaekwangia sp.]|nr:stage II sporulation protein M [Ohtaekwangia sp.]